MEEKLLKLIKNLKSDRSLTSLDEASTKQAVILRILSYLGWDPFNIEEVRPEYSVGGKRVDYSLRHANHNKVFIEVKKIGEDLEKHQDQLLNYAFKEGVKLAILTNGITWWFYLPLNEGSWEQRKFYTIEIYNQDARDITQKFIDFLSKEKVISGEAVKNAENIYKSRQKRDLIKVTLPKAWDKLIREPDESLVELIAETTEKLCGYKPDNATVEKFLYSYFEKAGKTGDEPIKPIKPTVRPSVKNSVNTTQLEENYTGKSIVAFAFKGIRYEVRSWKDMLIKVCDIMASIHRDSFDRVLNLVGRKRPYFTKFPNELRVPEKIDGTDIYVEVHLSANSIVKLSKDIIGLFGYKPNDLSIEIEVR